MKLLITLIVYLVSFQTAYSQCEDIAFLYTLYGKGYAEVDEKLDSRGYLLMQVSDSATIVWINKGANKNIAVTFDKDKTVQQVSYQLADDVDCYNDLKSQIVAEKYTLDFEELSYLTKFRNLGGPNYYYQGETHGALLIKGSLGEGTIYQFILVSLEKYRKERDQAKKLSTNSLL